MPETEMFPKAPEGYRLATTKECEKLFAQSQDIQILQARAAQFKAEIDAGQLRLKDTLQQFAILQMEIKKTNEELKLPGKKGDLHQKGLNFFVLEDETKRLEELPDDKPKFEALEGGKKDAPAKK
jgi:hypothetical protein